MAPSSIREGHPCRGVVVVFVQQHELTGREPRGVRHDHEGLTLHRISHQVDRRRAVDLRPSVGSHDDDRRGILRAVIVDARAVRLHQLRLIRSGATKGDALVEQDMAIDEEGARRERDRTTERTRVDGGLNSRRRFEPTVAEVRRHERRADRGAGGNTSLHARRPCGSALQRDDPRVDLRTCHRSRTHTKNEKDYYLTHSTTPH